MATKTKKTVKKQTKKQPIKSIKKTAKKPSPSKTAKPAKKNKDVVVEETSKGVYSITVNEQITDAITAAPISYNIDETVTYTSNVSSSIETASPSEVKEETVQQNYNNNSELIQENASYHNTFVPAPSKENGIGVYVIVAIALMLFAWMFVL